MDAALREVRYLRSSFPVDLATHSRTRRHSLLPGSLRAAASPRPAPRSSRYSSWPNFKRTRVTLDGVPYNNVLGRPMASAASPRHGHYCRTRLWTFGSPSRTPYECAYGNQFIACSVTSIRPGTGAYAKTSIVASQSRGRSCCLNSARARSDTPRQLIL